MRLNRYLASCGLGSRRYCDKLILSGAIRINGNVPETPGIKVTPEDIITFKGREVSPPEEKTLCIILNKPSGVIVSRKDPRGRPVIYDIIPREYRRLKYAGRLDMNTEGLLIMTNNGIFAQRITHPSCAIDKEYRVTIKGSVSEGQLNMFRNGMELEDGPTAKAEALVYAKPSPGIQVISLVIHEGRKRQVRRMFKTAGLRLTYLERVRVGPLDLKGLPRGKIRKLKPEELSKLSKVLGLEG